MIEEGEGWGGARQCGRGSGNGRWVNELTAGGAQQVGAAAGASCALGGSVPAAEGARRAPGAFVHACSHAHTALQMCHANSRVWLLSGRQPPRLRTTGCRNVQRHYSIAPGQSPSACFTSHQHLTQAVGWELWAFLHDKRTFNQNLVIQSYMLLHQQAYQTTAACMKDRIRTHQSTPSTGGFPKSLA